MVNELQLVEKPKRPLSMNPKKFILWLFMVSIVMLFAAFSSAYVVRQSEGNWLDFQLPGVLYVSTLILLLSSVSMHWAYTSAKKDDLNRIKVAMLFTGALALVFLILQLRGWEILVDQNVFFVGNPAGSFMYVLTGLHGFHLISGIVFLAIVLSATFRFKVHSRNILLIEMCNTYWHFLDALWLYLFIFLLLNR